MTLHIAVINKSNKVSKSDVLAMTSACAAQIRQHAAPAWDRGVPGVSVASDETHMLQGASPIYLFDNPDVADALGYHDETPDGLVYGRVFVDPVLEAGGTMLTGELAVSSVLSHEMLELFGDPLVNLWATAPDGFDYAVELADAVEENSYVMPGTHVSVSNFVLPHWFDAAHPKGSRFDYLGRLLAPFSMTSGGYVLYKKADTVQQRFGEKYPEWRRALKGHPAARTARRHAAVNV